MLKYLILIVILTLITIYFFISTKKENIQILEDKKVDSPIKYEKKKEILLIDKIINTNLLEDKNYENSINYNKPKEHTKTDNQITNNSKIDFDVDVNKKTKDIDKIKIGLEKKF